MSPDPDKDLIKLYVVCANYPRNTNPWDFRPDATTSQQQQQVSEE